MNQVVSYSIKIDPALAAKIEAKRAALKPCCTRCRRNLTKREIPSRLCSNRNDCTVRAITRRTALKKTRGGSYQ